MYEVINKIVLYMFYAYVGFLGLVLLMLLIAFINLCRRKNVRPITQEVPREMEVYSNPNSDAESSHGITEAEL